MKAVIVMFDTLNRLALSPYGGDPSLTPNFTRLAARTALYARSYSCSLPCMPARRDFHTGRPGFLHREWGPLDPWDDSVPRLLRNCGVHTHLVSDHYHYWEEGGANYHTKYTTWEFARGQEGDPWHGLVAPPSTPAALVGKNANLEHALVVQDWKNRLVTQDEAQHPVTRTFDAGDAFLRRNAHSDRWCLHLECFAPHEPFFAPQRYRDYFKKHHANYRGPFCDWPVYGRFDAPPEVQEHVRIEYLALLKMCDDQLGRILDTMDELKLWDDTLFVLWTDHGSLQGEHNQWGKNIMPMYDPIVHTPFFVWDPRTPHVRGVTRQALVQPAIDLGPTLLRFFGENPSPTMLGCDLAAPQRDDKPVRETAIFGYFGRSLNVTDGRYVLMRGRRPSPPLALAEHRAMPARLDRPFTVTEMAGRVTLAEPFAFTKGIKPMRIAVDCTDTQGDLLFDLESDPHQLHSLHAPEIEAHLLARARELMRLCEAPPEQYDTLGLPRV